MLSGGFGRFITFAMALLVFAVIGLWAAAAFLKPTVPSPSPRVTPPQSSVDDSLYRAPISDFLEQHFASADGGQTFCSFRELGATDLSDNTVEIYAWVKCKSYLSQTTFIEKSASVLKPVAVVVEANPDKTYAPASIEVPSEETYEVDVRRIFPKSLYPDVLGPGALEGLGDTPRAEALETFRLPLRLIRAANPLTPPNYSLLITGTNQDVTATLSHSKGGPIECLKFETDAAAIPPEDAPSQSHEICAERPQGARIAALGLLLEARYAWAFGFAPLNADKILVTFHDGREPMRFEARDGVWAGIHASSRTIAGITALAKGKDVGGCGVAPRAEC